MFQVAGRLFINNQSTLFQHSIDMLKFVYDIGSWSWANKCLTLNTLLCHYSSRSSTHSKVVSLCGSRPFSPNDPNLCKSVGVKIKCPIYLESLLTQEYQGKGCTLTSVRYRNKFSLSLSSRRKAFSTSSPMLLYFFKNGPLPASFSLFSSFQYC